MKWEYKIVSAYFMEQEATLRSAGDDGWELVSVVPSNTTNYFFYFKREKPYSYVDVGPG